jgi:hypothetical protein
MTASLQGAEHGDDQSPSGRTNGAALLAEVVPLHRRLAVLLASGLLGALAVPVAQAPAASAPIAHSACTSATIGGAHRCIARGQFCSRAHARDYTRYGLHCTKRDRNGRYHLQ